MSRWPKSWQTWGIGQCKYSFIALDVHVKAWIVFLALSKFIISNASNFPSQQLKHLDGYVKAICSVSLSSDSLTFNICFSCLFEASDIHC